jgi:large subunit ribosomal protein L22
MEVRAVAKWLRTGPRKVRRFADLVRGKNVDEARAILGVQASPAARLLLRVVDSAVANADHNHGVDAEELYVSHVVADGALVMPRTKTRARGRADRVRKPSCHITVVVSDERATTED